MQPQPAPPLGLHAAAPDQGGEVDRHDHGHEKKPVLKKMKEKVKKIKDTIGKKTHGQHGGGGGGDDDHGVHGDEEEVSEEEGGYEEDDDGRTEEDSDVHGVVTPTDAYSRDGGVLSGGGMPERIGVKDTPMEDVAVGGVLSGGGMPERTGVKDTPMGDVAGSLREDPAVPRTVVAPTDSYSRDGGALSGGKPEKLGVEDVPLGDFVGSLREDPAAPRSATSTQIIGQERGGEEIGMSPMIEKFEKMVVVSDQLPSSATGIHDRSSLPTAVGEGTEQESYTEKLSTTARAAATAVYEKVVEAGEVVVEKGAAVMEKVQQEAASAVGSGGDNTSGKTPGAGLKGYFAEKLRPADEDKALWEATGGDNSSGKTPGAGLKGYFADKPRPAEEDKAPWWEATGGDNTSGKTPGAGVKGYFAEKPRSADEDKALWEETGGDNTSGKTPGAGVKGYFAEKLRPADEDKALSEAIMESFRRSGRKEEDAAAAAGAEEKGGGVGVMGRIRGAVTNFVGGGQRPSPTTEAERKGTEGANERQVPPEVPLQGKDFE